MIPEPHVKENYLLLHTQRGLSWEQLAAQADRSDRGLAAWMREQAAAEMPSARRTDRPRGRREQPTEIA